MNLILVIYFYQNQVFFFPGGKLLKMHFQKSLFFNRKLKFFF